MFKFLRNNNYLQGHLDPPPPHPNPYNITLRNIVPYTPSPRR